MPATVMPGFTHLQTAQPVTFGHHLLAYVEMLGARPRPLRRRRRKRLNECPLGAAALAGTPFPIDRQTTAEALGFDRPTANSLDAVVGSRLRAGVAGGRRRSAPCICRGFAEEIVNCDRRRNSASSRLSDHFTTGSSIMPQKRNPDAAELVRAKTGRIAGAFQALLTVMKGLPLAYSKDMQEDKEPVFDALDALTLALAAMAGMVARPEPDAEGDAARRPARASRPRPTSPTGWCASSDCRSARRTTSPARSWPWPKRRAASSTS